MRLTKAGIKKFAVNFGALLLKLINVILVLAGVALVGYGFYLIYSPSAFIVVGAIFLFIGLPDREPAKEPSK